MDVNAEVVKVMKEKTNRSLAVGKIVAGVIGVLIIIFFLNPFVVVGAGERGVVLNFGAVQSTVFGEGLHFRIPFMQSIVKMDVKVHKSQVEAESVSKDLQDTHSIIALRKIKYHYYLLSESLEETKENLFYIPSNGSIRRR